MSRYKTRELLFKESKVISNKEWERWILSLTVPASTIDYPLYHITRDKTDNLKWVSNKKVDKPKNSHKSKEPDPITSEILPMRISTAPTIEGCFGGIFPAFSKEWEDKKDTLDKDTFYLYKAHLDKDSRVLLPTTAKEEWLIYDAHLTQEHCIFGKVTMELICEVTIYNPCNTNEYWVQGYPYDCKKYEKNVWFPPVVIAKEVKPTTQVTYEVFTPTLYSKPETKMSSNKLNFSPPDNVIIQELSMEAMNNPLQALSEGLTTKFSLLLSKLTNIDNATQALVMGNFTADVTPAVFRRITEKHTYMQLSVYGVGVPDGFIGPLNPYLNLIEQTLGKYLSIRKDVLTPAVTQLGVVLANPDKLQSNTLSPLSHVKFKTKEREYFEKYVQSYYSTKNQSDNITLGRLFSSNGDMLECAKLASNLESLGKEANKVLDKIIDDIQTLKELANRLSVRVMQDKQTYGLNAKVASEIANIISEIANEISFFASLIVICDQAIGIMDNVQQKVN